MPKKAPPPLPPITIGICVMDKKADGKPMKELLKRLENMGSVEFVRFGDELLLNVPVAPAFALECVRLCLHTHTQPSWACLAAARPSPPARASTLTCLSSRV
jgi:hypothetical protein